VGTFETSDDTMIYRQDDGEITARFASLEEKMELSHEGSRGYRRVFNLLVLAGLLYLAYIFFTS
jgi:hypothetical protein